MLNADKPHRWKADVSASVDMYNEWFLRFAPHAYRTTRVETTLQVQAAMDHTDSFAHLTPAQLKAHPEILPTLRMATAPPIARDRLIGLAYVSKSLVQSLEAGKIPPRMPRSELDVSLERLCDVLLRLLDHDLFSWIKNGATPDSTERYRAATIVADRLCGAVADPIVRNAQEARQLQAIENFLTARGYRQQAHPGSKPIIEMEAGTFCFRMNLAVGEVTLVNIPIDVVIQPQVLRPGGMPVLIEAKSAGDFTNTNKRRKEEATKIHQLRATYGPDTQLVLFLCGYFDSGYLGYEAAEGLDWAWEHRIDDLLEFGL
jgi:hypothetical protein